MTNVFKIGDKVRIPVRQVKKDADGNAVMRWNKWANAYSHSLINAMSEDVYQVVSVPDGKRKRYAVLKILEDGSLSHHAPHYHGASTMEQAQ